MCGRNERVCVVSYDRSCLLLLVACCFLIALKVVFVFVDVSLFLEPVRSCFVTFCLCAVGIGIAALVIVVVVCRYD